MKFYLMIVKRTDILEYYGHEILYINKRPMIYNYVECCSYKFGGILIPNMVNGQKFLRKKS